MSQATEAQPSPPEGASAATESPSRSWILTRWLFIRLMGVIHLMAFASYAVQILGLNGSHGVIPSQSYLSSAQLTLGSDPIGNFFVIPTVEWFCSSDLCLQLITWGGTFLSILIILGVASGPSLAVNMLLWLSIANSGGEFTGFQSDGMLVEATLLSLFVVPWSLFEPPWPVPVRLKTQNEPPLVGIWLLRFMIFRLMLAAGAVKILSHDETWSNLTAMHYHFETQPLPTPLGWYFNQLPDGMLKGMVLSMFVSELIGPCLVFGTSAMRYVGAFLICSLQAMIAMTGNYTFLNFLTMTLCVPMLDDRAVGRLLPKQLAASILGSLNASYSMSRLRKAFLYPVAGVMFVLAGSQLAGTILVPLVVQNDVPFVAETIAVPTLLLRLVEPFHVADRYGLFAVMTLTRPEIQFEGSNDGKTWLPYVMQYKVDDVHKAPPFVAPHMPRLGWRLWFAAMEPAGNNTWVVGLIQRMLEGTPEVMAFFERNPFPGRPPKYIRAWVYDYHFTNFAERNATGDWWRRDNKRMYLPPMTLINGQIDMAPDVEIEVPKGR